MKAPLYVVVVVLLVAMAACSEEESVPAEPLVTVEWRGGLCQYGGCSTVFEVTTDGAYRIVQGDGSEATGTTDEVLSTALSDAIARADFDAVRILGSTEICPTAYDGQEVIYTFHAPGGDERMSTCEHVLEWNLRPFPELLAILNPLMR